MNATTTGQSTIAALVVRQLLLLALGGAAFAWGYSLDRCAAEPPILWPLALVVWVTQSMFWLGWRHNDLKLLFLLSGGWVGVASSVAVLIIFIGAAVASAGDQTTIRIGAVIAMLLPLIILPRIAALWPSQQGTSNILHHVARSLFVIIQYGGVALLIAAIMRFCPS
ncbi:MAG: hypothetical protein P1U65_02615 [Minwuia sp.]|nr:hypothetical protein [Minwuia sp.]